VHTLTFRAKDLAGHVTEISQRVQVDTLPPQVNASLAGEQANGWYLSQVTFTAAASDDGSGLARIEYALDGASWQAYTAPVTVGDGIHILRVRALDVAGNQAEMAPLSFQVDGRPPQIRLTPSWYLWERGEVQVRDGESGLVGVEVEIRDLQGRWPKVVRSYEASGASFAAGIEWDRRFADGTLAPIGSYEVVVKAWDRAGNFARQTASLHIPAPNAPTYTPAPATTTLPVMVEAASPTPVPLQWAMEMAIPTPTVLLSGFRTVATPPVESQSRTSPTGAGQSQVLWGMAALGAIGAATAYALERRRKRKEEEARQAAEAAAEAARRNASEVARRLQNWLQGQAMLQNALNNPALNDAEKQGVQSAPKNRSLPDPETADMTEKERLSLYRQSERYRAYQERMQAWEAERKRQQAAAAYQRYRQGEWADPQPVAKPQKPLWQRAGDWLADRVDDIAGGIQSVWDAFKVRHLKFTKLEDGHISVRAETPPGTRIEYRRTVAEVMNSNPDEFFGGTRYNPETVAARTSGGLLRSSISKGSLALAGVTSLASNLWTFGTNPAEGKTFWDRTVKNRKFWVWTAVDFGIGR
jgi:hypothetical protein